MAYWHNQTRSILWSMEKNKLSQLDCIFQDWSLYWLHLEDRTTSVYLKYVNFMFKFRREISWLYLLIFRICFREKRWHMMWKSCKGNLSSFQPKWLLLVFSGSTEVYFKEPIGLMFVSILPKMMLILILRCVISTLVLFWFTREKKRPRLWYALY